MDFQQIRDFVNPAVAQATGMQEVENLSMPVPVAYVPVQLVIDGALSLTSENPVQNKVIAVAIQNLDGRITAVEGQFAEGVTEAVNNWLAAHPEATTTVQDGAISYAKLDTNLKGEVDQISELKRAFDSAFYQIFDISTIQGWIKGKFINTSGDNADINSPTSNADYSYNVIDCVAGDVFFLTGQGGGGPRLWAFLNDEGEILSKANSSVTATNLKVTAPSGATKIVINSVTNKLGVCYKGEIYSANAFLKNRIIVPPTNGMLNLDTANNKLIIPKNTVIISGEYTYENTSAAVEVDLNSTSSSAKIVILKKSTNTFSAIAFSMYKEHRFDNDFIVFCAIRYNNNVSRLSIEIPYTINGSFFGENLAQHRAITPSGSKYVNLDTTQKKLLIPSGVIFTTGDFTYETQADAEIDLIATSSSAKAVFLNKSTKAFNVVIYSSAYSYLNDPAYVYVCSIRFVSGHYAIDIGIPYTVDNVLFGEEQLVTGTLYYEGEKFVATRNPYYYEKFIETYYNGASYTQNGIAMYGNYLVTVYNPDMIRIYNKATKELLHEYSVSTNHGNSAAFSDEFVDESDPLPLLYCGYSNIISVIRITNSGATLYKQIKVSEAGYYNTPFFDFEHKYMYVIGYTQANIHDEGNNGTVLVMFDISNMTLDDGYYIPTEVSRIYFDYIGVIQDGSFLNGDIYVALANTSAPFNPAIVRLDLTDGSIKSKLSVFPKDLESELEGLCFALENEKYVMYVSEYKKMYRIVM